MSNKLVILTIYGDSDHDFYVTLRITKGNLQPWIEKIGKLHINTNLIHLYQRWELLYNVCACKVDLRIKIKENQVTNVSYQEMEEIAKIFEVELNDWLNSKSFQSIKDTLYTNLSPCEDIRFLIQTENIILQKFPWHLWNFFKYYEKAEISFGILEYEKIKISQFNKSVNKVEILSILGDELDLNLDSDIFLLKELPDANITILRRTSRQDFSYHLSAKPWDIIYFAGHAETSNNGSGYIYLNNHEKITIDELKFSFEKAVKNGLKLVILNSCDGLGLANDLARLYIPQTIVMRQPIPDKVAQEFLKNFLISYSSGKSLYISLREARQKLQEVEDNFPGASWLPVIFQNPSHIPPTWSELKGNKPDIVIECSNVSVNSGFTETTEIACTTKDWVSFLINVSSFIATLSMLLSRPSDRFKI